MEPREPQQEVSEPPGENVVEASADESPGVRAVQTTQGRFAIVITNVGKLAGIVGGIHEAAGPARYSAVLFWVALFLGSQALEDLLTRLIDRAMGK